MLVLNGSATIADVVALADRREQVSVAPTTVAAVERAHQLAAELSTRFDIYGRTTGVGANRATAVSPTDSDYGMRLLRSHAVDAGDPLDDRTVRAMLAVRLIQLCVPGAGLDPAILGGLAAMLNDDALPELRQYASIGTGDLAPLAGTALTLIGERPASKPLTPMPKWGADSALPFMSSSALTVARGCLALEELSRLERASSAIYVLSFLALAGNPQALSSIAAYASAAPYAGAVAHRLRSVLATTDLPDYRPARIQDPYGLRVYPVAQASVVASLHTLEAQLQRTLNSAQENPLFDIENETVIHHGAFYQASLSLELDGATLALALTAPITHSRIRMLNDPDTNGGNRIPRFRRRRFLGLDDGRIRGRRRDRRDPQRRPAGVGGHPGALAGRRGGCHVRVTGRTATRAVHRRLPGAAVLRAGRRGEVDASARARRPVQRGRRRHPGAGRSAADTTSKTATCAATSPRRSCFWMTSGG